MKFIADLHIHSRFSRATAKNLTLPVLDYWARRKGLTLIATGDATHPEWLTEIEDQLTEAEQGFYRLKPELAEPGEGRTRFILSAEISNIYKKDGRVRKNHSVILYPNLATAVKLSRRLDRIGNIKSDGRPILGLDARDLLELCLDTSPEIIFIPAHIWTPWFSVLGSKSGFDSIEECFTDLTGHIHALETGLSSDPAMNWRVPSLDRYILVSNSDAHSPAKLGREANLLDTDFCYPALADALKGQGGFEGTIEFFPEEGKYHLDGHRKCSLCLEPEETRRLNGLCPVCGRPVTLGVMYRVLELAGRPAGIKPESARPYHSLIPLNEILSEVLNTGPQSGKVAEAYERLLSELGSELYLLREAPLEDIVRFGGDLLGLGLERMRRGQVRTSAGYDGEYGRIGLFEPGEREALAGQDTLFRTAPPGSGRRKRTPPQDFSSLPRTSPSPPDQLSDALDSFLTPEDPLLDGLNPAQRAAVTHPAGPLCVLAGPGTGKTHLLTRRAAWLIREGLAEPGEILGVTFTNKAAEEMSARLTGSLPYDSRAGETPVMTFHALGARILNESSGGIRVGSEQQVKEAARAAVRGLPLKEQDALKIVSLAKQNLMDPDELADPDHRLAFQRYESALADMGVLDFDDLITRAVNLLRKNPTPLKTLRKQYRFLLVDEYQDINLAQYHLVRLLVSDVNPELTVIGDPDQAIYGFRGADSTYFRRFLKDFPSARLIRLTRNYRNTETILAASAQVITHNHDDARVSLTSGLAGPERLTTAVLAAPAAEAEYVAGQIEKLLGGTSHFSLDSGLVDSTGDSELTLKDVAVLYRLHALAEPLAEALREAGLPFQQAGDEELRETDHLDFKAEKISLLTMHAAKGLEFPVVFIIGAEQGLLPYEPPGRPPAQVEEERRLFYVAMTRARTRLFLTRARTRTLFGRKLNPGPSIFLEEISSKLKNQAKTEHRPPKARQLALF